jgi:hypothetical protein
MGYIFCTGGHSMMMEVNQTVSHQKCTYRQRVRDLPICTRMHRQLIINKAPLERKEVIKLYVCNFCLKIRLIIGIFSKKNLKEQKEL